MACCPFHGEKTPSFTVSEELQIFKCFGCGKAGDIFTFLQEYEKIDFREALEELAKLAGITLQKSEFADHQESQKKTLIDINTQVAKFYNYILTSHPLGKEALDYILKRGITMETIKTFNIGFSPKDSRHLINFITKKNFSQKDLVETGTFGISSYGNGLYDRFQDRLIFPLPNYRGNIVGFSGRIIPNEKSLPAGRQANLAKYINSPETPIYHKSQMLYGLNLAKEAIRVDNSVIVTEGEFDMISPYQAGIKNVVALKGTAFTPEQLQLLRRYTDTLILALDSDFAGSNAAKKSIELADSMAFDIKVLILGDKYKDPDEAIKADLEFFKLQLKNAVSVWDFIINSMVKANDINTVKGKQTVLQNVLPFLVKISNAVTRSDYFHKLATEIGSSEDAIYEESKKYLVDSNKINSIQVPTTITTPTILSKTEKFEELLLTLIIGAKNPFKLSKNLEKYLNYINTPRFQLLAKALLSSELEELKDFQDSLPAELQPVFQDLYFASGQQTINSEDRLVEIKKVTAQMASVYIKDELTRLSSQIAQLESADDETGLIEIEAKYNQLLGELSSLQIKK